MVIDAVYFPLFRKTDLSTFIIDETNRKDYDTTVLSGETGENPVRARRRKAY